jgi:hypothetical protein
VSNEGALRPLDAMRRTFALPMRVRTHARLVLLALVSHARNADGRCWPSERTLARETASSERQVRRSMKVLRRLGIIVVVERRQKNSTIYELRPDVLAALASPEACQTGQGEPPDRPRPEHLTGQIGRLSAHSLSAHSGVSRLGKLTPFRLGF